MQGKYMKFNKRRKLLKCSKHGILIASSQKLALNQHLRENI